jgi:DNA-binding response OmpR family regulator
MTTQILLVDDEPQLLFSVSEYLSRLGYLVNAAESGPRALEMLVESPPDLIISDILMEEMDGFEFQRRVDALTGSGIPFIFLSAKGDLADRLEGLRGGADDYIIKPFEPEELEARIAAILHRVEQTRREERRDIDTLRARTLSEVASRLRTPVTSLMGHMNLLMSQRFGDDKVEESRYLQSALDDANVLCDLITDLSWAASDVLSDLSLKREPIRVAPIVRSAAAVAARIAQEKAINLQISCGGLLSGNIDGPAMTRALATLLESAVELSPTSTDVSIAASRAQEGGLEFTIMDGGCEAAVEEERSSLDQFDFACRVIKAHDGQISSSVDPDGRHKFMIWVPGRVAKRVGRHA